MDNKYSLTFPQKNIWLVEKFFGKSPINTIVGILNINKEFDFNVCEKAVNKLVEVNDALRLKVIEENEEAVQYVDNYNYFNVDFFDVTDKSSQERRNLEERLTITPFDVINNPLYYFAIIKVAKDKGYIFVKLHHLISDAWSFSNVATELAEYIDIFTKSEEILDSKPSYIDFIESEKEYVNSEKFKKDKTFWEEYLSGFTESVGLKENPNETLTDARRYTVTLDENLNEMIKNYCKENRVSPYTIFMNALAIYLYRVTEKSDFVIGTPVLNRSNFKEKKMMGMFVSTMPVRFKINESETFLEMCKKSASETMFLFRHQKYPYSLMLKEFREKNNVNCNLYNVMISYQNARAEYSDNEKYTTNWMFSTKVQDEFAIHIMDMDETGILQVHFDYLINLFEDVEIEYIAKRLFTIIYDGIKNNKTIENIEIMPEEEKNKIIYEFNDTKRDYPKDKTVIDLFEEQVLKTPDNIAVVFEGEKLTYRELNDRACKFATYLKENNISKGDMVGILIDKSFELIVSIISLLKIGACYVPVEKNYNDERKEYIFKNAGCNLVLVDNKENISIKQINVKEINTEKIEEIVNTNTPDSPNCVLYTSGTTGEPKGAVIVDRNIVKLVRDADYITFVEEDKILQAASTSFDVSLFEIWGALLNGATLHLIKKMNLVNPVYLKEYMLTNEISVLWITSALFNQMIEADAKMFIKLRRIFTGGDVISIKHVNMLKDACPNLLITNCYGPTECVAFTNTYNIYDKMKKRIPLGRPISNTTGYVVDSKNRLLPLYVPGEYLIGGESVGLEYINNPNLTLEKFITNNIDNKFEIDRLYKTGDIVQMIDDGKIDFIGRRDNQIKIRGFRIELDEIKVAMQSYGNVKDAVAIVKVNGNDKKIYAYYTSEVKEDNNKFISYLKTKIPIYMVPSKMLQLDSIPINQNGKIDRKNLPEIKENIALKEEYDISKYTGVYKIIYDAFKEVTNVYNIKPLDSFFDLGGDSISVIKVISSLSKNDISITFQDIYKYPSIKELGDMLDKNLKSSSISEHLNNENYIKIDELLSQNIISNDIKKNINKGKIENILLTGVTGFLGAHILYKYLERYPKAKVYCLVRRKENKAPYIRLNERLEYFFGKDYVEKIKNNIIVVEGDSINDQIFESYEDEKEIIDNVDIIINSAAYVKHFGDLNLFYEINTNSVKRLADFALKNNKKFIQISTLSVSGNILENGQIEQKNIKPGTIFNENKLFIGQNLDNVYAYTKFMAEKTVYDYILNKGLNAKVMRMGNLTGRFYDGKFQPNAEENAFAQRLKTIIELKVLPDNLLDFDVEFTPIDYAAEAVVILIYTDDRYNTFHLFNDNHIKMEELNNIFKVMNINLDIISKDQMTSLMKNLMDSDYSRIQGIVQDLNSKKELDYKPNTKINEDFTKYILNINGFKWPILDEEYIRKYLKNLYDIKFLKENE